MPTLTLDFDPVSSVSLESQMERLALEANVLANVIDTFRNVVPNLHAKLVESYNMLTVDSDQSAAIKELKTDCNTLGEKLRHASFINYQKTLISVPEGFKGKLLDFVSTLNKLAPEVFVEANKILGEYNFALSAFITNKESKVSLKDYTNLFHRVQGRRTELTKEMNKFFTENSSLSKAKLGDVISRFADLDELVSQLGKLEEQRMKHNLKEVSDSVKRSVELLNIVIQNSESNANDKISGNAAMNISNGAYEVGKFVEFISIFRYRTEQTLTTVKRLIEQMDKII